MPLHMSTYPQSRDHSPTAGFGSRRMKKPLRQGQDPFCSPSPRSVGRINICFLRHTDKIAQCRSGTRRHHSYTIAHEPSSTLFSPPAWPHTHGRRLRETSPRRRRPSRLGYGSVCSSTPTPPTVQPSFSSSRATRKTGDRIVIGPSYVRLLVIGLARHPASQHHWEHPTVFAETIAGKGGKH